MEVGDFVEVKGPTGHFEYTRPGHFLNHKHAGTVDRVNMIAGGTGITPVYQARLAGSACNAPPPPGAQAPWNAVDAAGAF